MSVMPTEPITNLEGEIASEDLFALHPFLYHYTGIGGLRGIVQNNTLRATHFADLNDSSEVVHLREPLSQVLQGRFLEAFRLQERGSFSISREIKARGGLIESARGWAFHIVDALYKNTFEDDDQYAFGDPFIVSFCSHSSDNPYERQNGLLSQWRGYGRHGGFCIVLDTKKLAGILTHEGSSHNWTHLNLAAVTYATHNIAVEDMFRDLIDQCVFFVMSFIENGQDSLMSDVFASFVPGATLFKHQGFREEREVRIVAMRTKAPDLRLPPLRAIKTRSVKSKQKRYVSLCEGLGIKLPIEKIIIGPSKDQNARYKLARDMLPSDVSVCCSSTPYLG